MAKNARRVQRGMWITSERRVRRIVPSRWCPRRASRRPRITAVCAWLTETRCVLRKSGRGRYPGNSSAVSMWPPRGGVRRTWRSGAGAAVDHSVAALRTAVADHVAESPNERSSARCFHRGPTAVASMSDTRPSMRVRRLAVSDTGRGRRLSVEAVPMPPRGPWRACFTTSRCAVETASPQACDMGIPK